MQRSKAFPYHDRVKELILQGKNNLEIAKELGLTKPTISGYVQKVFGGNKNYLNSKTKHKDLQEKLLRMRLVLSNTTIRKKLNLTKSEMASCLVAAYRNKKLLHIRKDTRRRDSWSSNDLRVLLKYSGILPLEEINDILKRGNSGRVIKEKLRLLNVSSKNINGLSLTQFKALFKNKPNYYLQTSCGPACGDGRTHFKIVPWCHINEMLKDGTIKHSKVIVQYVEIMSMFQKWVHGNNYWESLTSKKGDNFETKRNE